MMSMRRRIKGLKPEEIKALPKEELENIPLTQQDFETSLKKIQSSVSASDLKKYEEWMAEYGSA